MPEGSHLLESGVASRYRLIGNDVKEGAEISGGKSTRSLLAMKWHSLFTHPSHHLELTTLVGSRLARYSGVGTVRLNLPLQSVEAGAVSSPTTVDYVNGVGGRHPLDFKKLPLKIHKKGKCTLKCN